MKYTRKRVNWLARQFGQLTDPASLSQLLGVQLHLLQLLALQPRYNTFRVPKKNGTFRLIEDPEPHLKQVQKRLNTYLQCVYYLRRTPATYGFQISVDGDNDPRNILTNARRHVGNPWMLNADFLDFFHQVNYDWVYRLFTREVFTFEPDLAELLAKLTTYGGRLAMGAPTSPVLSNLATMPVDDALTELARSYDWTYTRFADDLTVSAQACIAPAQVQEFLNTIAPFGLAFNEAKFAVRSPAMPKTVTGLVVTAQDVQLPASFVTDTLTEIEKLGHLLEIHYRSGRPVTRWLEQYQQQVEGQLAFAEFILDDADSQLHSLRAAFVRIQQTPDLGEPVSWINAAYLEPASHTLY
ncbi:reverse transcriptase family protein [Spirosoma sordidisoli]|nr:reverse transcriptase family protein [Spirosoma sordidisoli]